MEPEDVVPLPTEDDFIDDEDALPVAGCVPVAHEKRTQRLNPEWFRRAMEKWPGVVINLFVNRYNAQLPDYASDEPRVGTWGGNPFYGPFGCHFWICLSAMAFSSAVLVVS
ncbi:hypothetical protein SARC_03841 [Sphaeroforma arctica JP610]|uniref:Uncharacterized protein n=1 Tax=Sphaeroforma arctica JP610 TaxID=667725 RepID=A0A0L0G524_9EUKA|nr:hypothetical protein SARC_03841 [Sphaeroforma arctica JP610]KNC83926.1 hypothetical protein SARC_03841 [Sphaeroforma arctica JP610]|eukprot:XP_014157828.1 hypothetical protein SARC_03841 [Sphaeroforma arctica JP610]